MITKFKYFEKNYFYINMLQCVDVGQDEITKDKAAFVIQFVRT